MDKSTEMKVGPSRRSSALQPPPLFRSIGPPGLLASLPPHRRLRSLFCRSRAVLPANARTTEASNTFTDIHAAHHAHMCSLHCSDGLLEDVQSSTVESDSQRRAVLKSGVFTHTWGLVSKCPRVQSKQPDTELFSDLRPSATINETLRGREARLVAPLQTSEDPAIKEKQQQKRRKRSYRVECAGKQKYVVPLFTEEEEDARLCEWLQSLGIDGSKGKDAVSANNQQRLFVSRCRGRTGKPDTVASHRRDRRPHFLPPINQSDSLLHVPLLLPENSPPPSPCTFSDAPIHSLPVPLQQPLSRRRT